MLNAALRSQTIPDVVAENLDQILPPATDLPATARAGLEALSAIAVREPLEKRLAEVGLDRLFRAVLAKRLLWFALYCFLFGLALMFLMPTAGR